MEKKDTLILGLGNTLLSDDGVGIYMARELSLRLKDDSIDYIECNCSGIDLLELIEGYTNLIVLDSIKSKEVEVGEAFELDFDSLLTTARLSNTHGINFATMIELGKQSNISIPENIKIFVIEVEDTQSFSDKLTNNVQTNFNDSLNKVQKAIKLFLNAIKE